MKIILFLILFMMPVFAADEAVPRSSLFFTPTEIHQAEKLATQQAPVGQGDIRLGAVIYYGPQDWVLWLQGERWTPQTVHENLRVLAVTRNDVRLSWHDDEKDDTRIITLHPNQIFQIATGKIILSP